MNVLEVKGLVAGYGEAMVLRDVSLQVAPGEVLAVLGKNGMGKSTLLKTIMGFLPVHAGAIRLFADDALGRAPHRLASRGLAYSPQDQAIFQDLTVEENLRVGLPRGVAFDAGLKRIAGFFPFLANRRRQRAGTLSGGEQKMLIIGRALLARPVGSSRVGEQRTRSIAGPRDVGLDIGACHRDGVALSIGAAVHDPGSSSHVGAQLTGGLERET